ncbi:MAG: DUF1822 family protein, partial [Kovacikia sp.]
SQEHATDSRRWNAYLNQVCLEVILDWIRTEEAPEATSWLAPAAASAVWEFVNGSAIDIGNQRLVLIPTEVIEDDLEVPQEWVDIPGWAGDYYLGVEVGLDGASVRVWGYTTHQALKTLGNYDADDRFYSLDSEQVSTNLTTFSVIRERCAAEQTRAEIAPLPEISTVRVDNLIQRLSTPSVRFPRLAVPFQLWGALLANDEWQQRLYQPQGEPATRLTAWLQGQVESAWQAMEAVLSPQKVETAWGTSSRGRGENRLSNQSRNAVFEVSRVKVLDFGDRPENDQVALLIGVSALDETDVMVGIKISPVGDRLNLPGAVQVRLLGENGNEVGQASAAITETIQLQFRGQRGESFSVEVTCDGRCVTEPFEI